MRVIEELGALKLQLIFMILVLISTVLIQICDSEISSYNQKILENQSSLNNLLLLQSDYRAISKHYYLLTLISSTTKTELNAYFVNDIFTSRWVTEELKEQARGLNNGSIKTSDFLIQAYEQYQELYQKSFEKYNHQTVLHNNFLKKKPSEINFKKWLIALQVFLLLFIAFGYFKIMLQIKKRVISKT